MEIIVGKKYILRWNEAMYDIKKFDNVVILINDGPKKLPGWDGLVYSYKVIRGNLKYHDRRFSKNSVFASNLYPFKETIKFI